MKKQDPTALLAKLDHAVQQGMKASVIARAHKELLAYMANDKSPAPKWDDYPIGRDFWLQVDPVNG